MKVKLIHTFRDLVDHWDQNPFQEVTEAQIDEAAHVIRNVCVLGTRHSKNGYDYEDPAIDRLAQLADGAKFFVNHPSKSETKDRDGVRDIRDWAGVYSVPRKEGADKIFADLKVRPAFWDLVRDVAIMKPPGVGNSINSRVKVFKDQAGKEHVVDIDVLRSIDLVASAATTQNLFESERSNPMEIEEIIDQILLEAQVKVQGDMVFQLVRDVMEGILADKIKEKEKERKIRELQWKVEETIADILKDKDKDMKIKKSDISAVLDDFESMINDVLAGKKTAIETKKEDEEMEFGKITLEDLTKERPDLVKIIRDSIKGAEEMETIKKEHGEMKVKLDAMTQETIVLKTNLDAITKERDELKKKVDEFEAKEKGAKKESFISEKITELKMPKDIITDVFKNNLMVMEDEEIVSALKDRKEIFLKGQKVVRNAGDEYQMPITESLDDMAQKEKDSISKLEQSKGQ